MPALHEYGWPRKLVATVFVCALVGGVQWYIFYRTRPPEPAVQFPKELRDIAP
ncbi:MAG: hypothetical protein ABIT76_06155 [Chthoniobacterales bacterium]